MAKSGGGSISATPDGFNVTMPKGLPKGLPKSLPKGLGKLGKFMGGNSDTIISSDIIEYLGATGIDLISDVLTDNSPLFE